MDFICKFEMHPFTQVGCIVSICGTQAIEDSQHIRPRNPATPLCCLQRPGAPFRRSVRDLPGNHRCDNRDPPLYRGFAVRCEIRPPPLTTEYYWLQLPYGPYRKNIRPAPWQTVWSTAYPFAPRSAAALFLRCILPGRPPLLPTTQRIP